MEKGIYDLLKNVQPADTTNLNILNVDVINAKRINTLKDKIDIGEIISYEKKCTLTIEDLYTIQAAVCTIAPDLIEQYAGITYETDVDIYELVFWCNDARSAANFTQMGATLYIPQTIKTGTIASYSQTGAILEYTNNTPRQWLQNYITGEIGVDALIAYPGAKIDGYIQAAAGYVTIVADLPSFGVTTGRSVADDRESRIYTDVGALIATKKLIINNPDGLFDQFIQYTDPLSTIYVILEGYAQGSYANFSKSAYLQANLIEYKLQPTIVLNAAADIPAALNYVGNGSYNKVVDSTYLKNAKYINYNVFYLLVSSYAVPSTSTVDLGINIANLSAGPNMLYDVLTRLNTLYSPKDVNTLSAEPATYIINAYMNSCINNLIYENDADPSTLVLPWVQFDAKNNNAYIPFKVNGVVVFPDVLSTNPLYFNMRYLVSPAQLNSSQLYGNVLDYTANTLAFKGSATGSVTIVDIHNGNGYGNLINGINGTNYSTDQVTTPDLVPTYFKSFITGSQITQTNNVFWGKFTGTSDNSTPINPQWKINNSSSANFGKTVAPMSLNRNELTRYRENLNYPTDPVSVDNMVANIKLNVASGRGIEYQMNTTGKSYSNQAVFQYYYDTISYKIHGAFSKVNIYNGRTSDGADYTFRVPDNYNGTVFIYSHGYRFPLNVQIVGITDYPEVISAPQASPYADVTEYFTSQGYAMIGSGFIDQGWIVDKAVKTDVELIEIFKSKFPSTRKVIAWGESEGGYITTALREQYPYLIDAAAVANQANVSLDANLILAANVMYMIKIFLDNRITFDMPTENDARVNINNFVVTFQKLQTGLTKYGTYLQGQLPTFNPADWAQWGFVKPAGLTANVNPSQILLLLGYLIGIPIQSAVFDQVTLPVPPAPQVLSNLFLSLKRAFGIFQNTFNASLLAVISLYDAYKQCGGNVYGNTNLVYSEYYTTAMNTSMALSVIPGSPVDFSAVLSFIDNSPKILSVPSAVAKLQKFYRLKGTVNRVPTVSMEALYDPITTPQFQQEYINMFNNNLKSQSDINKYFSTIWFIPPDAYSGAVPGTLSPTALVDYYNGKNYNTELTAPIGTLHVNYTSTQIIAFLNAAILAAETGVINSEVNELMRLVRFNKNDFTSTDNPTYDAPLAPIPLYYLPIV